MPPGPDLDGEVIDFRRPAPLLAEQEESIRFVHDELAERASPMLSSRLRTPCRLTVTSLELVGAGEVIEAFGAPFAACIWDLEPLAGGRYVLRLPLELATICVDILLGGPGRVDDAGRPWGEIEPRVLERHAEHWLPSIDAAWGALLELSAQVSGVTTDSAEALAVFAPGEPVLRVALSWELGGATHAADVWIPHGVLAAALRGHEPAAEETTVRSTAYRDLIEATLQCVDVDLCVAFPPVPVRSATLMTLRPGDIIHLSPTSAPLVLRAGRVQLGEVRPARSNGRTACQITSLRMRGARRDRTVPTTTPTDKEHLR